ncbi:class I SAM-dependent methyltransferase [Inquilinus limosus]|uniref:class I SAM-dependent methyltransferase n=1 Tax=Inquilinus limosus TaxID=171674 RepID=UPI003F18418E
MTPRRTSGEPTGALLWPARPVAGAKGPSVPSRHAPQGGSDAEGVRSPPDGKRRVAALYTRVAPDYAELGPPLFAHAGRRLMEIAGVAPGDRVLDIATGRGAVLFPAAERVGPAGQVTGIDLAEGMVAHTAAAISKRGLANAAVRQMDAEALAFPPASFDRVLCSFAVFFFPDLSRTIAEVQRVLRPGGTIGFAFSRDTDPRWGWYEARLRDLGILDALPPPPGHGGIRRAGALVAALTAAGIEEAQERVEEAELFFPDEKAWWRSLWTHGTRVPLDHLASQAPETLARFKEECLDRVRALKGPRGIPERYTFVYVTGRRR